MRAEDYCSSKIPPRPPALRDDHDDRLGGRVWSGRANDVEFFDEFPHVQHRLLSANGKEHREAGLETSAGMPQRLVRISRRDQPGKYRLFLVANTAEVAAKLNSMTEAELCVVWRQTGVWREVGVRRRAGPVRCIML